MRGMDGKNKNFYYSKQKILFVKKKNGLRGKSCGTQNLNMRKGV